jgi:hypothetical protein
MSSMTDNIITNSTAALSSQVQRLQAELRVARDVLRNASMASMSDITATPLGHTDFTLSTVTPAPRQQRRRQQQLQQQQQQQRVRQLYDSTPGHADNDSSSGVTAEQRQQHEQDEFVSVLQVSAA